MIAYVRPCNNKSSKYLFFRMTIDESSNRRVKLNLFITCLYFFVILSVSYDMRQVHDHVPRPHTSLHRYWYGRGIHKLFITIIARNNHIYSKRPIRCLLVCCSLIYTVSMIIRKHQLDATVDGIELDAMFFQW